MSSYGFVQSVVSLSVFPYVCVFFSLSTCSSMSPFVKSGFYEGRLWCYKTSGHSIPFVKEILEPEPVLLAGRSYEADHMKPKKKRKKNFPRINMSKNRRQRRPRLCCLSSFFSSHWLLGYKRIQFCRWNPRFLYTVPLDIGKRFGSKNIVGTVPNVS